MAVVLKVKVDCARCRRSVERSQAKLVENIKKGSKQFECFECFKKKRSILIGLEDEPLKVKQDMFCGRCKYHFRSKEAVCPYCNQSDFLIRGDVSVRDLL